MNFLGLSFLFALPLIAVPVMIHLYRGRQRDVISWGAMQFLEQATTKGRSIQRLEELLLMFLRVAAVLALVLALAQPMLRNGWFGSGNDREVVLLLDNSLSMARTVEGVSASDLMIEKALELVGNLSSGDMVHILLAAGGGQWLTAEGFPADSEGKRQLASLLEGIEPTLGKANLLDCLQIAVNLEPQDQPTSRQIIVFSDNQVLSWQLEAESSWQQLGAARENSPLPIAIDTITCGFAEAELKNLAVVGLEASRQLARPEKRVEFSARVTNLGETASEKAVVEWLIDEKVFHTNELRSLAPQEATRLAAQLTQKEPGNFAITCRLQAEDQIALDNRASVVIEVSDQLPILVVHALDAEDSEKSADRLFSAALGYAEGKAQDWHAVYQPEFASVSQLAKKTLTKYRAVVMLSMSELPAETHERLQAFVRNGGGLWVALGDLVDRDTFNRFWYDDGGGLSPVSLETLVSVEDTNMPAGSIHPPERDHPATAQLANTAQLDIDQARLAEYWQLVHGGELQREGWVLLESGDGSPLVVENLVGDGRVLVQAFPLGLEWSNLPQLKAYVVMIHDWLDYITAPAMARYNIEPGDAIVATVPPDAENAIVKLVTPAGHQVTLSTTASDKSGLVRYSQTQLPGLYRLTFEMNGEATSLPFYVARDANESEWQPLEAENQSQLRELAGLQFEGDTATATTTVANAQPSPRAKPIWGALLIALLGLLLGEQLLSNWLARQRTGVTVT